MASQHWSARPGAEEVARLRHAVVDYAASQGVRPERVQDLAIAVSEVVTNAVMHAYPADGRPDGLITVMATVNGDEMTVRVVDDGVGLRPRSDSPGAGLGLAIASSVARRMVVERPERGGTEVRMTFAACS
jgi:anti-sigma regulatory factor (Ser/Thr protein kinase)